jgi:hypothetical protein
LAALRVFGDLRFCPRLVVRREGKAVGLFFVKTAEH